MNEQLKIVISAEIDKLKKGCQDATKSIKEVGDSAEQTGSKSDSAFSKLGNAAKKAGTLAAKALAAGIAAAATGVAALVGAVVNGFAEYEQLVGGVETLFKNSAGVVKSYAENAFKTAGLSANTYMETVTGFSASLLQSLGGDTAAAAKYADMAITDMADNANKMGTSMESLQNAYSGFAKQNFTMLDNLKLGYGGTKEEMQRLLIEAEKLSGIKYDISSYADIVEAIHVVQGEMEISGRTAEEVAEIYKNTGRTVQEQLGTTAKEAASTIAGSVAMTKASWSNLITGIANDNADFGALIDNFVESASTAMNNILPRVEIALNGVAMLIEELLPIIAARIPEIITSVLPQLLTAGVAIVNNLLEGIMTALPSLLSSVITIIPQLTDTLLALLPQLIQVGMQVIVQLINGLTQMLPKLLKSVVAIIPKVITALLDNIGILLEAAIELFLAIVEAIPEIIPALVDALPQIIDTVISTLLDSIDIIVEGSIKLFEAVATAIPQALPKIIAALPQIITSITKGIIQATPKLLQAGLELFTGFVNSILQSIPKVISAISQIVSTVKTNLVEKLKNIVKFDWSLPKLKMPHVSISGKFSINPPSVPKFSISWYKLGGIFDSPTLFPWAGGVGGLGEDGAEAIVPLEKNTKWLDRLATMLNEKQGSQPIIMTVDGKTFAEISIDSINALTRQTGSLQLKLG
jgi:phage-related protein